MEILVFKDEEEAFDAIEFRLAQVESRMEDMKQLLLAEMKVLRGLVDLQPSEELIQTGSSMERRKGKQG